MPEIVTTNLTQTMTITRLIDRKDYTMKRIIIQLKKSVSESPKFIEFLKPIVGSDRADYLIGNHNSIHEVHLNRRTSNELQETSVAVSDWTEYLSEENLPDLSLFKTIREDQIINSKYLENVLKVFTNCGDVQSAWISDDPEPVYVSNDPYWQMLWHYHANNVYSTNAEEAWDDPDIEFGKGIVVATIEPLCEACNIYHEDFGVDTLTPDGIKDAMKDGTHPSLLASKYKGEWDIPEDNYGHATQTASMLVAQINNGLGHTGIIPKGKCKPYYYGHAPDWDTALDAIVRAANDIEVDVISVSLTGNHDDPATVAAVQTALALGVPVVWAAGPNIDGYEAWDTAPNTIAVTSHDKDGKAKYTVGNVSVSAPGIGIWRSSPHADDGGEIIGENDSYWAGSGNSLATPMVAGIVGMMLKKNKSATIKDIITMLYYSCIGQEPSWTKTHGYGFVSAKRAIETTTLPPQVIGTLAPTRLKTTYSGYKRKFSWFDIRSENYKETVIVMRSIYAIPCPPENIAAGKVVYRGTGKSLGNGEYETENYIWMKQGKYWLTVFNIDKEGNTQTPIALTDYDNAKTKCRISCYKCSVSWYESPVAHFEVELDGNGFKDGDAITVDIGKQLNFNDKPAGSRDSSMYQWDFGNGEKTTERNPSYTYTKRGTFIVKYRCGNPLETDVATVTVAVKEDIIREQIRDLISEFEGKLMRLIDNL